jgi:condensin complex subunit 1
MHCHRQWFGASEELMHGLFHAHPCPDALLARLVAVLYDRVFSAAATAPAPAAAAEIAADAGADADTAAPAAAPAAAPVEATDTSFKCSSGRLSRLLFVLGQGAVCSLVYAEKVAGLAKKAREKQVLREKEAAHSLQAQGGAHGGAKGGGQGGEHEDADSMEAEMGLAAATDAEAEQTFNRVIEVDLVFNEENILGKFHQLIAYIVANEKGQFSDPVVRENALLALCRYMTVSSRLCEMYLNLLFTCLESPGIGERDKTTIAIALGDLAFRFPNSLEPWIGYMYARLADESLLVRYNTLMVLTHLILNDMVKVKGQVSHVVMCLNDSSERVRGLASLFFSELSKRSNNPVYNLLGDVISFLSRDEDNIAAVSVEGEAAVAHRQLSQAEFQSTMTFLLSFVKKDKQADSLLERLVVRMGVTAGQRQRRHLAFCISLLPITDKGVKKMLELIRYVCLYYVILLLLLLFTFVLIYFI